MTRAAIAIALLAGVALAAPPPGADPDLAPWFRSLRVPGTGASCCDVSDCRPVRSYRQVGDGIEAIAADGTVLSITPDKILQGHSNPTGHAIACHSGATVYCFVRASET